MPMDDEATKARLKNLEIEVYDHVYDEPELDGVLARDSKPLKEEQQE